MDFTESKAGAAREIALTFGVLPLLLGLPGDNTFSNYAEANRAFWRQTSMDVVPDAAQYRSDRESRAIIRNSCVRLWIPDRAQSARRE